MKGERGKRFPLSPFPFPLKFSSGIMRLAGPLILHSLLAHATLIIDRIMVGQLGAPSIAAVGLAGRLFSFLLIIFTAVAGGAAILAAQARGANRTDDLRAIISTSLSVGTAAGLFVAGIVFFFGGALMHLLGAEPDVVILGESFLAITAFCAVSFIINYIITAVLRACGDTKAPLAISFGGAVLGTLLNFILIPVWGVEGAAWATLTSSAAVSLVLLAVLTHKTKISLVDCFTPSRVWLGRLGAIGLPVTGDAIFWQIGQLGFTWIVALLGTNALAAREIFDVFLTCSYIVAAGFSGATMILVGQELGRENFKEAEAASMQGLKSCFLSVISSVFILFLLRHQILNAFEISPETKNVLETLIVVFAILHPLTVPNIVFPFVLRSGGDTRAVLLITASSMMILGLPLAWIGGHTLGFGIVGAYAGFVIHDFLKGMLFWRRYNTGVWRRKLI